jgi:proteasome lid subunit RPN8/RPN11
VIEVPGEIVEEMSAHAHREFPNEACGLLGGTITPTGAAPDARAERFYPMRNADASSSTYRLDSKEQLQVTEEIEDKGWEIVGIFHSHTHSEAYPSETDRRLAFYPQAHYLLMSLQDREHPVLRGFTIADGRVQEQDVRSP